MRKILGILCLAIPVLLSPLFGVSISTYATSGDEGVNSLEEIRHGSRITDSAPEPVNNSPQSSINNRYSQTTTGAKSVLALRYYYFSPNGNDSNTGESPEQAWKSVARLKALIPTLQPGDNVMFERNGVWNEVEINISKISGTESEPIVFSAYGSGKDPVITGGKNLSGGFTQNGNIWTHSSVGYRKTGYIKNNAGLLINNRFNRVAIHPNEGYYTTTSRGQNALADDSRGWSDNELVGGQVVVKAVNWAWSIGEITSNTSGNINFSDLGYDMNKDQTYYFLQNVDRGLDSQGEWVYNNNELKVFYTGNLNSQNVELAVIDTVIRINDIKNVQFSGIEFRGANGILIDIQQGNNIEFNNCTFRVAGTGIDINSTNASQFSNSIFEHIHTNGITADAVGNMNISDNAFRHIHTIKGMNNDYDDWSSSIAIEHNMGEVSVRYNTFDTVMIAFQTHWAEANWYFERNIVRDYACILGDNAAVYCGGDWRTDVTKRIRKNIFLDAHHDMEGTDGTHIGGFGHAVYWDYNANGILVDSNTFVNANAAIYSNRNNNNKALNNKFVNCSKDLDELWSMYIYMDNLIDGTSNISNHTFTGNTFVLGKNLYERAFGYHINSSKDIVWESMYINNNTYQSPFGNNKIHREINDYTEVGSYTVSEMCARRQFDCESRVNPLDHVFSDVTGISEDEFVRVVYNAKKTKDTIMLGHTYLDINGDYIAGKIGLEPYETKILFFYLEEVINDDQAPSVPSGLRASASTPNSVTLTWNESSDNMSVKGYNIFVDGSRRGSSVSNSYTIAGLDPDTEYSFQVSAYDYSFNESERSQAIVAQTSDTDRTPPSVPTGLELISVAENSVSISWNPSTDNVGVTGYNIYANGLRKATTTTLSHILDKLNPGITYSITVTAFDAESNESEFSEALEVTTTDDEGEAVLSQEEIEKNLPDVSIVKVMNVKEATHTVAKVNILGKAEVEEFGVKVFEGGKQDISEINFPASAGDFKVINQNRVNENLQLMYNFSEGSGYVISDISGNEEPLDLYINNSSKFRWLAGQGLKVIDTSKIVTYKAPQRLINALMESNEITIESWIKPSRNHMEGPAMIASLSNDNLSHRITLAQADKYSFDYVSQLNDSDNDLNENTDFQGDSTYKDLEYHHLVYIKDKNGNEKLYVNGTEIYSGQSSRDFSAWNDDYRFSLANELTSDKPWIGTFFLVAVYSKALTKKEIIKNFNAGYGDIEFTTNFDGLLPDTYYSLKPFARTYNAIKYGKAINIVTPKVQGINNLITYPNPSDGNFIVYFEHNIRDARKAWIQVSDIYGKTLLNKEILIPEVFFGQEENLQLASENLLDGIYILTLKVGDKTASKRIVIRR